MMWKDQIIYFSEQSLVMQRLSFRNLKRFPTFISKYLGTNGS